MQLSSGTHIPDGLLAANALLGENSRQGVPTSTHALYQGFGFVISNTALGMRGSLYDEGAWSRYTGKERDTESGLDYFGRRYYGSNTGRWMSADPYNPIMIRQKMKEAGLPDEAADSFFYGHLENPQNWNKYVYAENNPLKFVDPTGAASEPAGHHLFTVRKLFESPLAKDFTDKIKTGPLSGNGVPNQPGYGALHRAYNDAVKALLEEAQQVEGDCNEWSLQQWKNFANQVLNSEEPAIKNFLDSLESNNPGAKAALTASISGYQVSKVLMARMAARIAAGILTRGLNDFFICFTCQMIIQHERVTHRLIYNTDGGG
jgi:RHS repeat-associated protein